MELEKKSKPAMMTTELAIGIGLAVVALFVAIGLFYQPLSDMFGSTNFKNMFNKNSGKTGYTTFNRDYSASQINVQITGAQGLEMLRRKANNKAIEVIEENFSNNNPNAISIAYLATAINILTGEPHICTYMKKDSDKHCDELEGYDYKVTINGNTLTVSKVNNTGTTIKKTIYLTLKSIASSILSAISIPTDKDGYPTLTTEKQYELIFYITKELKNIVERTDVLLINILSTFNNTVTSSSIDIAKLKPAAIAFTAQLTSSINEAYIGCSDIEGGADDRRDGVGCRNYYQVEKSDYNKILAWQTALNSQLQSATTPAEIASYIQNSLTDEILTIIKNDNFKGEHPLQDGERTKSSQKLKTSLTNINSTYGLKIQIPDCEPSGTTAKTQLEEDLIEITGDVTNVVIDTADKVVETAKTVATTVKDTAKTVANTVKDTAKEAKNKVEDVWDSIWD